MKRQYSLNTVEITVTLNKNLTKSFETDESYPLGCPGL